MKGKVYASHWKESLRRVVSMSPLVRIERLSLRQTTVK
jgi:hypothetical protein